VTGKPEICLLCAILVALSAIRNTDARTENGNDICLYLSEAIEAKNRGELKHLKEVSKGINYFFRYLEIIEMKSGRTGGRPYIDIVAREPGSDFTLRFTVKKKRSLTRLLEEPESRRGSTIAVTGRAISIDEKGKVMVLDPVIVRHKDRKTPKRGKELLGEVDPTARYYSFTAVKGKKVELSYADRDILPWGLIEDPAERGRAKRATLQQYTDEEWADYLLNELAKRDKIKASGLIEAKTKAGIIRSSTNAPALTKEE